MRPDPCIASHNLMHGLRLQALIPHYVALRDEQGLDLLCLQEDRFLTGGDGPAERPDRGGAGPRLPRCAGRRDAPDSPSSIDARTLACDAQAIVPLPLLAALNAFERLYIVGGKTKQKYALLAELRARAPAARRSRPPASTSTPRAATRTGRRRSRRSRRRCANATFTGPSSRAATPTRSRGAASPRRCGAARPAGRAGRRRSRDRGPPTTSPARTSRKLPHRTGVLLGKLGIDLPRRYDVICTNLPVAERGQVVTPDSDHDLRLGAASRCPRSIKALERPLTPGLPGD